MKLKPGDLDRLPVEGPRTPLAVLFYGEDTAQIAQRREALARHWGGPEAEADMRLDRLTGAQLRSDPAALDAALRSQGFFPGMRVVVLTEATDGLAETILSAARDATGAVARLIVTAGSLTPRSALRKGFESGAGIAAAPCYRGPMSGGEIDAALRHHGLGAVDDAARAALLQLSGELDRLSLDQLLGKLALWQHGVDAPLSAADIAACAPPAETADADQVMLALLSRDVAGLRQGLSLVAGGAVGLCIALGRQARQMLEARCAMDQGQGADEALGRVSPPVPFPRRRVLVAPLARWPRAELEALVLAIHGVDADLRRAGSQAAPPDMAVLERVLLRFAMRSGRG